MKIKFWNKTSLSDQAKQSNSDSLLKIKNEFDKIINDISDMRLPRAYVANTVLQDYKFLTIEIAEAIFSPQKETKDLFEKLLVKRALHSLKPYLEFKDVENSVVNMTEDVIMMLNNLSEKISKIINQHVVDRKKQSFFEDSEPLPGELEKPTITSLPPQGQLPPNSPSPPPGSPPTEPTSPQTPSPKPPKSAKTKTSS